MKKRQALHPYTAIINNTQKIQCKNNRHQALAWLSERFPEAFNNTTRIRPLKTGIMNDILQLAHEAAQTGISRSKLREAVVLFTRRLDYLTCLKAQEMRIDLNGNPVEPVTPEEAEQAANKIRNHIEKKLRHMNEESCAKKTNSLSGTQRVSYSSLKNASKMISDHIPSGQAQASSPELSSINTPSTVLIKHKVTRRYDPDVVARLKEKLGLRTQVNCSEETA